LDGWTHNYNVRLSEQNNTVVIADWQGSGRNFVLTNGVYEGDGSSALIKTNGSFVWQLPHGIRYWFDGARWTPKNDERPYRDQNPVPADAPSKLIESAGTELGNRRKQDNDTNIKESTP